MNQNNNNNNKTSTSKTDLWSGYTVDYRLREVINMMSGDLSGYDVLAISVNRVVLFAVSRNEKLTVFQSGKAHPYSPGSSEIQIW